MAVLGIGRTEIFAFMAFSLAVIVIAAIINTLNLNIPFDNIVRDYASLFLSTVTLVAAIILAGADVALNLLLKIVELAANFAGTFFFPNWNNISLGTITTYNFVILFTNLTSQVLGTSLFVPPDFVGTVVGDISAGIVVAGGASAAAGTGSGSGSDDTPPDAGDIGFLDPIFRFVE